MTLLPLIAAALYLAKVNGDPITRQDLRAEFKRRHGGHEKMLADVGETRKFLDHVIERRLLLQEGYRLELDKRPELRELRAKDERKRLLDRIMDLEIAKKSKPTDAEIKAFYDEKTTKLFEVRQIVCAKREEAEAIRTEIAGGGDFEKIARAKSIGHSREYGGRLPLLGWGSMDPAWEDVVYNLKPNELSPVIESKGTYEVVQLINVKTADKPAYGPAAERIRGILGLRKQKARETAFSDELFAKYHVQMPKLDLGADALARAAKEKSTTAVATWDGGKLTLATLTANLDVPGLPKLAPQRLTLTVERTIRQLVNEELCLAEARARHLERDPVVAAPLRDGVEDAMEEILYNDYVLKDATVTDDDVAKYYAAHKGELKTEERRAVAHIVVATQDEALKLRKRLEAGESFAELAKTASKDPETAKKGGNLGMITKKEVPKELAAVLTMKVNEISAPLKSPYGWHLIKLLAIVPPHERTLDEAREELRARLKKGKVDEKRAYWVKQLRAAAQIEVNDAELKKLADEVLVPDKSEAKSASAHGH